MNGRTAGLDDDTVADSLGFINIHYFAAGASVFGTEAKGAYEYDGRTYVGRYEHVEGFDSCLECHNTHQLEVEVEECAECHESHPIPLESMEQTVKPKYIDWCYTRCHHNWDFQSCISCH